MKQEMTAGERPLKDEAPRPNGILVTVCRDPLVITGFVILLITLIAALLGAVLTNFVETFDPATVRLTDKLRAPLSAASEVLAENERPWLGVYVLGTDDLGRDVFSRMLQGASVSLLVGFVAVGISTVVGIGVGATAGYFSDRRLAGFISVDTLLMRLTDIFLCFPTFFLVLTVIVLLPQSIYNIMVVIGLTSWMGTARFVRASFLSLREQEFVDAARALALPGWRIMFRHMLPNALGPVMVTASVGVASAILTESALSFLGFGVQPPNATWGNILSDGKNFIFDAPWLFIAPGVAIIAVVLAFNFVGEGLREAVNPRLRRL